MNAILDVKKADLFDTREKVLQAQREAAKNPNHPINDGLMAFFDERKRLLESRKNDDKK
jgi:hypothetical protein